MALKSLGFSVDEMSRMTMSDFIAFTDLAFAEGGGKVQDGPREATQEDIDRLLG